MSSVCLIRIFGLAIFNQTGVANVLQGVEVSRFSFVLPLLCFFRAVVAAYSVCCQFEVESVNVAMSRQVSSLFQTNGAEKGNLFFATKSQPVSKFQDVYVVCP